MLNEQMFQRFAKTIPSGEIIFLEFEPGDTFYFIQEGSVKVTKIIADKEKTLDIFTAGDIFGEMAILEQAPRSATVIAIEETRVLEFRKENFETLLGHQPALAYKILKVFCKRIFDAKRQLSILALEKAEVKIADVFLWLIENMGLEQDDTLKDITIPRTTDDIASLSGCAIEECRAILGGFKKTGVVDYNEQQFVIKRFAELHRLVTSQKKMQERLRERK